MRKIKICPIFAACLLVISGCSAGTDNSADQGISESEYLNTQDDEGTDSESLASETDASSEVTASDIESSAIMVTDSSEMFTDRDYRTSYDEEESIAITLSVSNISSDSESVEITGSIATITDEGTYIISGTLEDGYIIVDVEDNEKVQIVLDGADITSSTFAAIYVRQADKVFITTAEDSVNTLTNGGEYITIDDNNVDGVIFSKDDITLNGLGSLTINANSGHGIVAKDDLVITSGNYEINAAGHGFEANDSIRIADGSIVIAAGKDGMQAENSDDADLGYVYIAGGTFDIKADGDGISAGSFLQIDDGIFDIFTGGGSENAEMSTDTFTPMNRGMGAGTADSSNTSLDESTADDSVSMKGLKSDSIIAILGGTFTTDTEDDSIHAGGDIYIADGVFNLKSGDDAIHSDMAVYIKNGTFDISYCYEGIEGSTVTIDDGIYNIVSEDDGINAAGGSDGSGFGGMLLGGGGPRGGGGRDMNPPDSGSGNGGEPQETIASDDAGVTDSENAERPAGDLGNGGPAGRHEADGAGGDMGMGEREDASTNADETLSETAGDSTDANLAAGSDDEFTIEESFILINGGEFVIVSGGDCIDSNGDLTINGGTLNLTCNGPADTALDCDGIYVNNGGDITTNDGSENSPNGMGGGRRGRF